jgi:LmbE family N-acetylglucosaminyl deacetylase
MSKKIVAIGAHPDDIEMNIGGTLIKHTQRGDDVYYIVCTLGIGGLSGDLKIREKETINAANILGAKLQILDFPVLKLNKPSIEFVNIIKSVLEKINPDRVYTHTPYDYHQVHITVSECVTKASQHIPQVLFFESISSGNLDFTPNAYVDISNYIDTKIKSIECHITQSKKLYLQSKVIRSFGYVRYTMGKIGSNPNGMAEAFFVHRFVSN